LAVVFAGLLNAMLAVSLIWPAWLGDELRLTGWTTVGMMWLVGGWMSYRHLSIDRQAAHGDLFSQAVNEYLQGNYVAAESILERILRKDRRDCDARLLLVSLLRRMRRLDEAHVALQQLEQYRAADKWRPEIDREREQIAELQSSLSNAAAARSAEGPTTLEQSTDATTKISRAA
jgi:thioredoxin-like negative regulator of GroEL